MPVRKLGSWLAILAIALQAAWPLLAAAKPRAVALVPLCTVDGITHYLEVPTGGTPSDPVHHEHCSFCTLGTGALLPSYTDVAHAPDVLATRIAPSIERSHSRPVLLIHGARAPPFSRVVTSNHNFRRQSETALSFGRFGARAAHGGGIVRFGLLHGRYAVEHARGHDERGHAA
jgi:hypothetical protein